jgi:hypothetical protein
MNNMKKLNLLVGLIFAASCQLVFAESMEGHVQNDARELKADTNHDGNISRDEHAKQCAENFDMADTNHDGLLSKDERRAMHEKMRGKMHSMREKMQDKKD